MGFAKKVLLNTQIMASLSGCFFDAHMTFLGRVKRNDACLDSHQTLAAQPEPFRPHSPQNWQYLDFAPTMRASAVGVVTHGSPFLTELGGLTNSDVILLSRSSGNLSTQMTPCLAGQLAARRVGYNSNENEVLIARHEGTTTAYNLGPTSKKGTAAGALSRTVTPHI